MPHFCIWICVIRYLNLEVVKLSCKILNKKNKIITLNDDNNNNTCCVVCIFVKKKGKNIFIIHRDKFKLYNAV